MGIKPKFDERYNKANIRVCEIAFIFGKNISDVKVIEKKFKELLFNQTKDFGLIRMEVSELETYDKFGDFQKSDKITLVEKQEGRREPF